METAISDLTDVTGNTGTTDATDAPQILPPPSTMGFLNSEVNKEKVGRPKGLSAQAARIVLENTELLKNEIAMEWKERVYELPQGRRMKKNELDELIKEKTKEHQLTNLTISNSLI